jgi:WD40 repeat protein/transcriptional regulator with XRE-family HTH domain
MSTQPFTPDTFATFGDLLKYLRRRERLTQLELSIAVGYSEAQISRLEKNQRLPDLAAIKALFIPALHLEQEPALSAQLLALAQSARQEDAPLPGLPPYKGLLFFDEPDADLFFGRESLTEHLAGRVTALARDAGPRILAVVGASGSGKSSLVRAGLAVTLKQRGWTTHIMTPTAAPLSKLEAELHGAQARAGAKAAPILVLVDQFEEVFTLCHDEATRAEFIDRLLALGDPNTARLSPSADEAQGAGAATSVVITLRADFYAHCAQYPRLRQAVSAQQDYIGQMASAELRRAIEEPAKRAGWDFEPGLVDLLLHDIGAHDGGIPEPGALPLLSHALLATWERRRGRTLTLDGYHAAGGVRSAIAETAESVFTDQLDRGQQELARDVFLRLTELGEGTEDTRRRAALTELERQAEEAAQLRGVLDTLAAARLITLNEDSAEVAHEALIREWQRLHEWLMQDREGLRLHRHLTDAAREWAGLGRDAGALYRGARLAQAHEWAAANDERLNAAERAFLAASVAQEQHEVLEREAQRERELQAAQKLSVEQAQRAEEQARAAKQLRRRALLLGAALLGVVLLAGVAGALGPQAKAHASAAEAQRQAALAREVAGSAINNLATDPERSILLALQALQISTAGDQPLLVEVEDALHRAVQTSRLRSTLRGHDGGLWALARSGDGTRLATVSMDGTAKVWELATNQVLTTLPTGVTDNLLGTGAAFRPDGRRLLTISSDNSATLWDLANGTAVFVLRGHTAPVTSVTVSPDGGLLATASDDRTVKLWDAATGRETKTLTGHEGVSLVLGFSPDGKRVFAGSDETGIAIAWEVASGEELFRFSGQGTAVGVEAIAASPDGARLATGEFDTTVKLWDAATGTLLDTLFGHASQVVSVAYSADGSYLASGSEDGTVKVWDALAGREVLTLGGHTSGVMGVAFSADGNHLYSASRDGTARIWDVSPAGGRDWLNLAGHGDRLFGVAYLPDGGQLATWSWDGTVKVWDAATGEVLHTLSHENSGNGGNASYSPDGSQLAVVSGNGATVFDAQSGTELFSLPEFAGQAMEVLFSPDGARLALASNDDGTVRIFDSTTGSLLLEFPTSQSGNAQQLWQMAFSPDGKRLTTAKGDGAAVWDAATGEQLLTFSGHGEGVRTSGITFSPDGKWVATTGNDAAVQVWDATTGELIYKLTGHTGPTFGVAFSPDGGTLASSSVDRTVKIWRLPPAGRQVPEPLTLHGHTGAVYRVAFSPDGARLASSGRNPIARVYTLKIDDLVAIAESQVTRELTLEECQKFLHTDTCPSNVATE